MSVITTLAPSAARSEAACFPIPWAAPVTIATLFSKRLSIIRPLSDHVRVIVKLSNRVRYSSGIPESVITTLTYLRSAKQTLRMLPNLLELTSKMWVRAEC